MKIIIAGGRSYNLTDSDIKELDKLKSEITEVVSGTARGVDSDGEKWAESNNIPVKRFKPDWAKYGRAAGPIRNRQMADYADALAVFPGSTGTDDMYRQARKKGLKIYDFRRLKDFKEYVYQEGFGFDWSKLKPKQLNDLFKKSSKEIELSLAGKKAIEYLVKKYNIPGVEEFDIRTAYNTLAAKDSNPNTIRRKIEGILKGPNPEIDIKNLASPIIYKKYNIQQEIIRLDTELDKKGVRGLLYFSEDDKPYDLFRLNPVNQRQTLRLLKTKNDLLLSIKVFYAFKLAPVANPSLGKSTDVLEDGDIHEDPYVFDHEKSSLKINASEWQNSWKEKNKQINEIEKNIRKLTLEKNSLPNLLGGLGKQIVRDQKQSIDLMLGYLSNSEIRLTKDKFDEICAKSNVSPPGYELFNTLYSYSKKYYEIQKEIDKQNELKTRLQKEKRSLSSTYFKPPHYIGKRKTVKSERFGTIQAFLKDAENAFIKIMKKPKTENQKMVQMYLVDNCVDIYTQKNPDKKFDYIIYPESRKDDFGENFNKYLASEFARKYGCPAVEMNKLPKHQITANEEGAKTYYEFKGLDEDQIKEKIKRLRDALEKVKSSGQIKSLQKQELDYRFFIKMYSKDILRNNFENKKILVIDDNTTSGATFQQISEILSLSKPYSIDFYVPFVRQM